jgi:hypothetical protein
MIQAIQVSAEYSAGDKSSPARQLPAVAFCCDAWEAAFLAAFSKDQKGFRACGPANRAYRNALPPLCGYQGISDFIACVAYGMVIDAIQDSSGDRLLHAAQVALATLRHQPKTPQTPAA